VYDLTPPGPIAGNLPQAKTRIVTGPDNRLWFPLASADNQPFVGAITTTGVLSAYQLTSAQFMTVGGIAAGPDGNLWVPTWAGAGTTEMAFIFRITTAGTSTYKSLPTATARPFGITSGPDGNVWAIEQAGNLAQINPSTLSAMELPIPNAGTISENIVLGPDGAFWFTEQVTNEIGRMTTGGVYSKFEAAGTPADICVGPDGNLWFTAFDGVSHTAYLGRMTVNGGLTQFTVPQQGVGITPGPDGNIWFMYQLPATLARFIVP
jgi:virginiamycin B lyase